MAKKKKEEEEEAWLWMSQPFSPGAVPVSSVGITAVRIQESVTSTGTQRGTKISSMGPGPSIQEQAKDWHVKQARPGGAYPAFLYYGWAGLADPKAPFEAYGYGGLLGLTGWKRAAGGVFVGGIIGFTVGGTIGVVIDPLHQWEGGLDETAGYKATQRDWAELEGGFLMPWKETYVPTM